MGNQEFAKPTFTENVILEEKDGFFIYDFNALDVNGNSMWYLFAVSKANSENFLNAVDQENTDVDISEYGQVLASGQGEKPSEEVRQEIVERYKFSIDS